MVRNGLAVLFVLLGASALADDVAVPAAARAEPEPAAPAPLPKLPIEHFYLVDYATDTVLAERAPDVAVPPASLTKLMTAYVVLGALADGRLALHERVRVSEKAWRTGGTRMFIEVRSEVEVEDLLRGMLIQSGNDAAVALAERVGGSVEGFVALMNEQAAALGMTHSVFKNPTGLPAKGHVSSAHDLAILARRIIADFPDFYGLYSEREFTYNGIKQHNRNALLWRDPSVDGMKTGYTEAAGYCLVSSAQRGEMRLIAVVLGGKTPKARNDAAAALLEYGFANFETHRLYTAGEPLGVTRVRGGAPEQVGVGLDHDLVVTIPRGRYAALAATMDLENGLAAPLAAGTPVGAVKVALGDEPLAKLPVVLLEETAPGGVWSKLVDEVSLWLE